MTVDELVALYPKLFHMAESGAWPSVREHGLRTTEHMVTTSGLPSEEQDALLRTRRPVSTPIEHPRYGPVVIRDQKPLALHNLEPALTDMTIEQWLAVLNDRVFFWLHPDRLGALQRARAYRESVHDVITVDTRRMVAVHGARIRLSPINSGATIFPKAATRGSSTFTTIDEYPLATQRKKPPSQRVAELAVIGGVPDIATFILRVDRMRGNETLERLV